MKPTPFFLSLHFLFYFFAVNHFNPLHLLFSAQPLPLFFLVIITIILSANKAFNPITQAV